MHFRRGIALVKNALLALVLVSAVPAAVRAQDVFCDTNNELEVRAVRFQGNATFSSEELSARVLTTPSSFTRRYLRAFGARRCYPDIGLQNDVANLKLYYQNYGFYDTRVDTIVTTVSPKRVDVTFRITEGQPLVLDSLTITGLDSIPDRARILHDSLLHVGTRVGRLLIYAQQDTITNRLRDAGYPRAAVFPSFDLRPSEHRAEVLYDVQPGPRARFGTIAVRNVGVDGGAPKVDSAVVRALVGFRTGDLYSDRAISQASRNLYNLSMFRHVDVSLDTNFVHGDTIADVNLDLREDYMKQLDLEEGWGQLDCFRLNSVYTDKNFQDQARRFEFTARLSKLGYAERAGNRVTRNLCDRHYLDNDSLASSKVNDYFGVTVRYPTLLGRAFTPSYSVYTQRQGQYQAYLRTTDIGGAVSATRDIAQQTPFTLGYSLEAGSTRAEPVVLCAFFNRCTVEEQSDVQQRLRLGVASASIQRTRTDNPVAPTRGYVLGVETRYSAPFLISDPSLKFFKMTGDVSWYAPIARRVTFAARARGGFISGGQQIEGTRLPPPQERLYAGGPTSVRGFQQNQLGPQVYLLAFDQIDSIPAGDSSFYLRAKPNARQDRSIPGGGNLLAVFNTELRIRDPFFPDLLEYIPFIDAGQVWATQIEKNLHRQPLAVTPGLSVRYFSPVGPVQVNLGYNRYDATPGAAYYISGAGTANRPLLCVTSPGESPLIVTHTSDNRLVQDVNACPANFSPAARGGFFRHLNLTLSIGTDF